MGLLKNTYFDIVQFGKDNCFSFFFKNTKNIFFELYTVHCRNTRKVIYLPLPYSCRFLLKSSLITTPNPFILQNQRKVQTFCPMFYNEQNDWFKSIITFFVSEAVLLEVSVILLYYDIFLVYYKCPFFVIYVYLSRSKIYLKVQKIKMVNISKRNYLFKIRLDWNWCPVYRVNHSCLLWLAKKWQDC